MRRDAVKIVTLRVRGRVQLAEPALPRDFRDNGAAPHRQRSVYFGRDVGWLPTPVLTRKVPAGSAGPLVIEEYDTTIVVPPQSRASASAQGDIFLEVSA
jgi:N-methylhydantoinase A/oxoprolinase/acetone carboxylase beta subunit